MSTPPAQHPLEPLSVDLERPSTSTAVCSVRGEIDLATEAAFRAGLERTAGAAPVVVVDLTEVTFIGSIAAAIIYAVLRELSDHQVVKLVTGRSGAKLFAMLGLDQVVDCFAYPWSI
ncbi:STAS domain-containing protein [Pseudonocardia acidicola]|uniref:STAS domain-containing protein n=1 Tax=Pseudonocardia acidicola TaxID=2724939 RepID=A0ABX1S7C9_9PSEU|nr:STAS domain-containing protein [Pseudonocardia acidicola]NMH96154.1 STAS domain-containing protein [Pseudonocardia acidicola]